MAFSLPLSTSKGKSSVGRNNSYSRKHGIFMERVFAALGRKGIKEAGVVKDSVLHLINVG